MVLMCLSLHRNSVWNCIFSTFASHFIEQLCLDSYSQGSDVCFNDMLMYWHDNYGTRIKEMNNWVHSILKENLKVLLHFSTSVKKDCPEKRKSTRERVWCFKDEFIDKFGTV